MTKEQIIKTHTNTVIHYLQQLERLEVPNAKETLEYFLNRIDISHLSEEQLDHVKDVKRSHNIRTDRELRAYMDYFNLTNVKEVANRWFSCPPRNLTIQCDGKITEKHYYGVSAAIHRASGIKEDCLIQYH